MIRIDWYRLIRILLPTFLRGTYMVEWLMCLIRPIRNMYLNVIRQFELRDYTGIRYQILYGSQVCHLKKILNDAVDPGQRRISIDDAEIDIPEGLSTESENEPLALSTELENEPIPLMMEIESEDAGYDFKVNVPAEILNITKNELLIRRLLNVNKLASKRYLIFSI